MSLHRDAYKVLHVDPDADEVVIQAAYRALARKFHPDHDSSVAAATRMSELNLAYGLVGHPQARAEYDRERRTQSRVAAPAAPGAQNGSPAPQATGPGKAPADGVKVEFGRYEGWLLSEVMKRDPEYLRWLLRRPSGARYKHAIESLMKSDDPGRAEELEEEQRRAVWEKKRRWR